MKLNIHGAQMTNSPNFSSHNAVNVFTNLVIYIIIIYWIDLYKHF